MQCGLHTASVRASYGHRLDQSSAPETLIDQTLGHACFGEKPAVVDTWLRPVTTGRRLCSRGGCALGVRHLRPCIHVRARLRLEIVAFLPYPPKGKRQKNNLDLPRMGEGRSVCPELLDLRLEGA